MDADVRVVTELRLRRETDDCPRAELKKLLLGLAERAGVSAGGLDESTIQRWENREHVPCAVHQRLLCDHFGAASIGELGLGNSHEAARWWTLATSEQRRLEVYRRKFVAKMGAAVAAALLPVDAAVAAAQQVGGVRRVTAVEVEAARHAATSLAASYQARPDEAAAAAAVAHARTLGWQLNRASFTPGTRAGLETAASDAAALAGRGAVNHGRREEAAAWFQAAVRLARQAGDRRLEALAVASTAWAASPTANPVPGIARPASLDAVQAAAALDHQTAAGAAWLNAFLTEELSHAGEEVAAGRALERMQAAAARVAGEDPGWGAWSQHAHLADFDGSRPDLFAAVVPLQLGRHADAVALMQPALTGLESPVRRRLVHGDLARAHAGLDQPEAAAGHLGAALDLAEAHGLVKPELVAVRAAFPGGWAPLDCVKAVDERLRRCR